MLTTDGELLVVRRSPEKYEEVKRYKVAESQTWAQPVLVPDGIVIRDASGVTLWSLQVMLSDKIDSCRALDTCSISHPPPGRPLQEPRRRRVPHHRTREPFVEISQANAGLIRRDLRPERQAAAREALARLPFDAADRRCAPRRRITS